MSHRVTFDDLLPTHEPDTQPRTDFDLALRGYDRRQVDDYLVQVDETLADATRKVHGAEQQAVEAKREAARLTEELEREKERVGGEPGPEPKAAVGGRIAQILTLAEQEAADTVTRAQTEAEQILGEARRRHAAATELHDRAKREVDSAMTVRREEAEKVATEVATEARRSADTLRQQSQQSAEALRQQSQQEAEERRVESEREATRIVREARKQADRMVADSRRMVAEATSQRDRIARQLSSLRKGLAEVAPEDAESPPG